MNKLLLFVLFFLALDNCLAQEQFTSIPWNKAYKKSDAMVKRFSNTYSFNVKYKNEFIATYQGEIKYNRQKKSFYLECKEGVIYPAQTLSISRIMDKDTIIGNSNHDKWLFRIDSGVICTYSVYAESSDLYVNYVKLNADTIYYEFTESFINKVLPKLIEDDITSIDYLNKAKKKYAFRTTGAVAIGLGLLTISSISPKNSALAIASALAIPIGIFIPSFTKPPSPVDVIRFYNTRKLLASIY